MSNTTKTVHDLLTLKKYTSSTINELIREKEDDIRLRLNDIFTDVATCEGVGEDLIFLARMKDARLLMNTNAYKVYEAGGKKCDYEDFLEKYNSEL